MKMSTDAYTPELILDHFRNWELDQESQKYLQFHAKRYAYLIATITGCIRASTEQTGLPCQRMLDVGPSALTQFMRDHAITETIDSLGYEDCRFKCRNHETHAEYDLTQAVDSSTWPQLPPYDVIIMAEVIEHLPIPPEHVLAFLAGLLKPHGFLIIQTPNACSLPKRLRMARGQNPYEMIRNSRQNPGHFREYTVRELTELAQNNGLRSHSVQVVNYFLRDTWSSRLFRRFEGIFPATLRDGITLCLGRND